MSRRAQYPMPQFHVTLRRMLPAKLVDLTSLPGLFKAAIISPCHYSFDFLRLISSSIKRVLSCIFLIFFSFFLILASFCSDNFIS